MATLRVRVVPNAKIDKVVGQHGDAIKIKLRAPAVEGKANAALRSFLGETLEIGEDKIDIVRGAKSRQKLVRIEGWSEAEVRKRLLAAR